MNIHSKATLSVDCNKFFQNFFYPLHPLALLPSLECLTNIILFDERRIVVTPALLFEVGRLITGGFQNGRPCWTLGR